MPENAVRNMDTTGYVSVVGTKEVLISMDEMLAAMDEVLCKMEKCDDAKQYAELEAKLRELISKRDALLVDEGINLGYFFKDEEGNPLTFNLMDEYDVDSKYANYTVDATCVYVDPILYPDQSVIDRCAMMHDSGSQTENMLEMWSRVKGDNLSTSMLIFILVSFGIMLFFGILGKVNAYRKRQKMLKRRRHTKSKQQPQTR